MNWLTRLARFAGGTQKLRADGTRHAGAGNKKSRQMPPQGSFAGWSFDPGSPLAPMRGYAGLSREGFMRNPVVHRCVRLIAETSAATPLLVYVDGKEEPDHPAASLLQRPNPHMAGPDFLETLFGHLLLSGNAYLDPIVIAGQPRAIYLLRPDRVTIRQGADGWPNGLDYQVDGGLRRIALSSETDLAALHLKLFHPLDELSGFSPLAAAQLALDLHNAASRWNKGLIDNSARPSGALVYQPKEGGNLTPQQYQRLRGELDEGFSGPQRAGRPLLLEGGLDWKPMGLSPRDMDFAEVRNGAARDLALAFGVPPMLIGIPGDNTYSNYIEANRGFARQTVLPMVGRLTSSLTAWLAVVWPGLRIEPDLDRMPGLAAERSELWARIGAASFLTPQEKRQAVGY